MFRIEYKPHHTSKDVYVLHDVYGNQNKLIWGRVFQNLHSIDTFEFDIGMTNSLYNQIDAMNGVIRVINTFDDSVEFSGRILKPTSSMDEAGFVQSFIAEDYMSYFNDSIQVYAKIPNNGVRGFLSGVIETHNAQVEPFKRFKLGRVTVENETDLPYRYIGYESTLDTLRVSLLERIGGVFKYEETEDGLILHYLQETEGEHIDSPIQIGKNIKSATREVSFENLVTRLIPVGADLPRTNEESGDYGAKVTYPRLTIESVNNGLVYLEDRELVAEFGLIHKIVNWSDIDDAQTLKNRGQQYLDNQAVALSTWDVEVIDLSLLYERYKKFEVGNYYKIINPAIANEELQVISKEIDIINPQASKIRVGSDPQSLSVYLLQQQEAQQSIEKVMRDNATLNTNQTTALSLEERIANLENKVNTTEGA